MGVWFLTVSLVIFLILYYLGASLVVLLVMNPPAMQETACNAGDLCWEDSLEKEMAVHSNILASEILQREEPGGLQSMGLDTAWQLSMYAHI